MENRFEHTPEEENESGWGAYATPPPTSNFGRSAKNTGPRSGSQEPMMGWQSSPQKSLCTRVSEMLPSLLEQDGDIRPEMAASLHAHLASCQSCKHEYIEMQRVVSMLEALPALDIPMDFSGAIMRRIQLGEATAPFATSGEKTLPIMTSAPHVGSETARSEMANRSTESAASQVVRKQTTGQSQITMTRSVQKQNNIARTGQQLVQRLLACSIGLGLLVFFLSLNWGRQMLGVNVETAGEWLGQIRDTVQQVPVLGPLVSSVVSTLAQASGPIRGAYHEMGAASAQGIAIDAALVGVGAYLAARQRARRVRL